MSTADNTAQLHHIIAGVFFQPDYVEHVPFRPGTPSGMAGFRAFWTARFTAFPDFYYTVEDVIAEHWATIDQLGMLQQLGVIPAPGSPS